MVQKMIPLSKKFYLYCKNEQIAARAGARRWVEDALHHCTDHCTTAHHNTTTPWQGVVALQCFLDGEFIMLQQLLFSMLAFFIAGLVFIYKNIDNGRFICNGFQLIYAKLGCTISYFSSENNGKYSRIFLTYESQAWWKSIACHDAFLSNAFGNDAFALPGSTNGCAVCLLVVWSHLQQFQTFRCGTQYRSICKERCWSHQALITHGRKEHSSLFFCHHVTPTSTHHIIYL